MADDVLRIAPQNQAPDTPTTVRAAYDKIGRPLSRLLHDTGARTMPHVLHHEPFGPHSSSMRLGLGSIENGPALRAKLLIDLSQVGTRHISRESQPLVDDVDDAETRLLLVGYLYCLIQRQGCRPTIVDCDENFLVHQRLPANSDTDGEPPPQSLGLLVPHVVPPRSASP